MRTRDVAKLTAGTIVVVAFRELGQKGPEQLATFVQYNADRQTWHPSQRQFTVAITTEHGGHWIRPTAIHRVATKADVECLAVRVTRT